MRLKIKKLGPIKEEANIDIGDLTVFFGPPNSGKSTALKAIYYSLVTPDFDFEGKPENVVTNYAIDIKYDIEENALHFTFYPSSSLKHLLPEGEFTLEPFSFADFISTHVLYEKISRDKVQLDSIVLPEGCDENKIRQIKESGVEFEAEISRNSGHARIFANLEGLSQECRKSLYREIGEKIVMRIGKKILSRFRQEFWKEIYMKEGVSNILFIPYHRSLLTLEIVELSGQHEHNLLAGLVEGLKAFGLTIFSDIPESFSFIQRLTEIKLENKIYNIIKPLIPGDLQVDKNGIHYVEGNKVIDWSFTSASIMEAVSLLLTLREGELVLYEEPETQFHEKLQVLMGLILYALTTTNKLVITTHSQTILYTLAFLSYLKPTAEEVSKLLDSLGIKNDELAKDVEEANKKRVKFYYFHDGKVEEKSSKEVADGIPGVTDVMDKELKWFSELYLSRVSDDDEPKG